MSSADNVQLERNGRPNVNQARVPRLTWGSGQIGSRRNFEAFGTAAIRWRWTVLTASQALSTTSHGTHACATSGRAQRQHRSGLFQTTRTEALKSYVRPWPFLEVPSVDSSPSTFASVLASRISSGLSSPPTQKNGVNPSSKAPNVPYRH